MITTAAAVAVLLTAPSAYAAEEGTASLGVDVSNGENGAAVHSDGAVGGGQQVRNSAEVASLHMPLHCETTRTFEQSPSSSIVILDTFCTTEDNTAEDNTTEDNTTEDNTTDQASTSDNNTVDQNTTDHDPASNEVTESNSADESAPDYWLGPLQLQF